MDASGYKSSENTPLLIRDMASEERPREKAIKYGIKSLSNTELMAILFGTGVQGKSVVQLSNEILADNDHHLSVLARMSVEEILNRYKGIGPAKAVSLLAALEIGSRAATDAAALSYPVISSSQIAVQHIRRHFDRLTHEEFWIMLLSQARKPIKVVNISRGGVAYTAVDVRIVMKHAVENLASSMILFHNHPSGNISPSRQDDELTKKIKDAAKLFDINVDDHIIVTDTDFYSYNDQGRL